MKVRKGTHVTKVWRLSSSVQGVRELLNQTTVKKPNNIDMDKTNDCGKR